MRAETDPAAGVRPLAFAEEKFRLALIVGKGGFWELRVTEVRPLVLSPELLEILDLAPQEFDGGIQTFLDRVTLADEIAEELRQSAPSRPVDFQITPGLEAVGDKHLLRIVLANLLSNAWKFSSKQPQASIVLGFEASEGAFFVQDDGTGFDPAYTGRLFGVYQRLHVSHEFAGRDIGLATVQRIINRHGGRVWARGSVDHGATFYFSLPRHETS